MKAEYDYPEEYWDEISAEGLFFFSFSFFFVLKDRKTNFLFCVLTAKDFIDHLLVVDVAKRLTAEQGLNHPWLRQVHLSSLFTILIKRFTYLPFLSFSPCSLQRKRAPLSASCSRRWTTGFTSERSNRRPKSRKSSKQAQFTSIPLLLILYFPVFVAMRNGKRKRFAFVLVFLCRQKFKAIFGREEWGRAR